jgi:hypothetical protein
MRGRVVEPRGAVNKKDRIMKSDDGIATKESNRLLPTLTVQKLVLVSLPIRLESLRNKYVRLYVAPGVSGPRAWESVLLARVERRKAALMCLPPTGKKKVWKVVTRHV